MVGHDSNSKLAVEYGQVLGVASIMHTQYLRDLIRGGVAIPAWLRGVPTLVYTSTWDMYEGSSAVKMIFELQGTSAGHETADA